MSVVTRVTPEELLRMPDGKDFELVDGELVEREMGSLSSRIATRLATRLDRFAEEQEAGSVFGADAGLQCFPHEPDRVRKPDVSFVSFEKLTETDLGDRWIRVVPDLVVEVVSPNDVVPELRTKLDDYAEAGVPVVWVIYPETATVEVHRPDGTARKLPKPVELVGEGPLEGFRCPLADVLPRRSKSDAAS